MAEKVIQVEEVSKWYRLGKIGAGSLRQDIRKWWLSKVADISKQNGPDPGMVARLSSDHIWALRDISFELNRGEVLGIIGKNGAGKSTLLKILSRIIKPSSGTIRGRGKVSSLLEIGTGFHWELSGRENIFLSGYMLGMNKREIQSRFDEIVTFSGVADFLDTPVKRYSSGMYVRLAFAVAAHLEPDILIVDEVLAVGDASFQKKCMGKMREVSKESGRTILFVSHNMQAVNGLCSRAIWLEEGRLKLDGNVQQVVNAYSATHNQNIWSRSWGKGEHPPGNDQLTMRGIELLPEISNEGGTIDIHTPVTVRFRFHLHGRTERMVTELLLFTAIGECIFAVVSPSETVDTGHFEGFCKVPGDFLNDGSYYFTFRVFKGNKETVFSYDECLHFTVDEPVGNKEWYVKWWGYVRPNFPVIVNRIDS
ncbi:polysaccharide ABC transporter ATP-binding protein [Flavihumibacter rivuli]|uniref:ABC transporter ATP-binding protein n=1 Tax=Flavihumibacter rivuli TaxID=2838156 RepID=UPI001BDF264A|nr:polysaccharide ABC transporter ATP-binding protein [Flavihumibacter rivuli]ULQ56294.1 polysaccharide ABC transporter ATP-binding protein [Flavihumibacter rivuli]